MNVFAGGMRDRCAFINETDSSPEVRHVTFHLVVLLNQYHDETNEYQILGIKSYILSMHTLT